ncbi:GNAT family N-acetyltransferase [Alkalicoccobacillus murimartini]|uniref:Ribosomal protein S18 acetylase RimI-like enzyme n=1 Tax=Alkalicoccobacillus murimartini TaxID=171685 RepID=A0ABT9YBN5_9BACI|nr:GNAT family N-acetyltransferase [Alkalicoccobacillus murimartini]MDQ0205249.1 ribosomal protein S18 acetylase RimI-like enzyme [Alkalicoccobacillus murimartini]
MYFTRLATSSDVPAMCDLMHQAFATYSNPPSSALDETIASINTRLQKGEKAALLFNVQGRLLAMVRFVQTKESLFFFRFSVHPDCQGSGIGSLLLRWLETYATKQEISTLTCKVRKNVTQNLLFYQKNGYIEDTEWHPESTTSTAVLKCKKTIPSINKKKTCISS